MNNYGVWVDEFKAVSMEHTLELTFPDATCWFGEGREVSAGAPRRHAMAAPTCSLDTHAAKRDVPPAPSHTAPPPPHTHPRNQVRVGRAYGRVSRRLLRQHLLQLCAAAGVRYLPDEVAAIETPDGAGAVSEVATAGGAALRARLVTLASGQAAGRFLKYEEGAPGVAAQTAYGIEAEVEG